MSAVSSATLVSSPSGRHQPPPPAAGPSHPGLSTRQRTQSHSSMHHAHHAHAPRRKGSAHAGPSRRGSEGEGGRRALTSGLMMQGLDGAAPGAAGRRKADRPPSKSSRSDTHLPRLSRNASATSIASDSSRPGNDRKRSGESVTVLSEDGVERPEQPVEGEGEGEEWESGEDETVIMTKSRGKGKDRSSGASTPMRRSTSAPMSHEGAVAMQKGDSMGAALASARPQTPHLQRQKTTGFAGSVIPPDPHTASELVHGEVNHHYNDAMHVMPAHQVKHQKSARSLHALAMEAEERPIAAPHRMSSGGASGPSAASAGSDHSVPDVVRRNPTRTGSTLGSGLPPGVHDEGRQTSFPFPKAGTPSPADSKRELNPVKETITDQPLSQSPRQASRQRTSSRSVRHRRSNSSLRTSQTTRASPHPLNGPRPSSVYTASPTKVKGPSLLQPPLALPVVYKETASGAGYDIPENEEVGPLHASTSSWQTAGPSDSSRDGIGARKSSFSSINSLRGNLSSMLGGKAPASPSASAEATRVPSGRQMIRRKTAMELAEAASKMSTTSDQALYHHSLGYSPAAAETAHLVSRFLPPKRGRRPTWEVTPTERVEGTAPPGLLKSNYRDAHESLVRMMKDASGPVARRSLSRNQSGYSIRPSASAVSLANTEQSADAETGIGLGVVPGSNTLHLKRGWWRGRSPLELSVERCLAQRPQRTLNHL